MDGACQAGGPWIWVGRMPLRDPSEGLERDDDPQEEASADGCEVTAPECSFDANEGQLDGPDASEFRFSDELDDAMVIAVEPIVKSPIDGLPVPADASPEVRPAPPFTHHTMVCVEDEREFVEVFFGDEPGLDHETMSCFPDIQTRWDVDGVERKRRTFTPDQVCWRWGTTCALAKVDDDKRAEAFVPVRPVRERCRHYVRQSMNNDDVPDEGAFGHRIVFRNCSARRSVGGAFMSLRDCAVYACDLRYPPDPRSTERFLDAPDRKRLVSQAHLVRVPLFNLKPDTDPSERDPSK